MKIIHKIIIRYICYRITGILRKNSDFLFYKMRGHFDHNNLLDLKLIFYSKNLKGNHSVDCKKPCFDCDGCDAFNYHYFKL